MEDDFIPGAKPSGASKSTPTESMKLLQADVLKLKSQGLSYAEIGQQLGGYGHTYIHKIYKQALKAIIADDVADHRKIQMYKLDLLYAEAHNVLSSFIPYISSGQVVRDALTDEHGDLVLDELGKPIMVRVQDLAPKLQAIDRCVRIMERQAKLLGLDAPTKIAPTNPEGDKPFSVIASPEDLKL